MTEVTEAVDNAEHNAQTSTEETEIPTLEFENGLPGFPDVQKFALIHTELAQEPFSIMRCLDADDLEFVVTPPALFFPEYEPVIDDSTVSRLGIESADDVLLLSILTIGDSAAEITANLMAPVVINTKNRKAAQTILNDQELPIDAPLFTESVTSSSQTQG